MGLTETQRTIMKVRLGCKVGSTMEIAIVDLAVCPRVGETICICTVGEDGAYPLGASFQYPSFQVMSVAHNVGDDCAVSLGVKHERI